MDLTFTSDNAAQLLQIISPFVTILATYIIGRTDMKTIVKVAIALITSAIMGALTSFAQGDLVSNLWSNLAIIFTASQGLYFVFFKGLNLEALFYPQEALASKAAEQVRTQVAEIPAEVATAVLNPDSPVKLETTATVSS